MKRKRVGTISFLPKTPQGKDKNDRRPAHERLANFPANLKRLDLKMMVNGKLISGEQQLYDNIKNDRCKRCHKKGHFRRNCPNTTPKTIGTTIRCPKS
jgi:hypothetical protein